MSQRERRRFLRTSYWSPGMEFEVVRRAIDNSLAFVLLAPDGAQVGSARDVTDRARFAWIADVFARAAPRQVSRCG